MRAIAGALVLSAIVLVASSCGSTSRIVSAGPQVDMSNHAGWEAEATIAVDPHRPTVLLAGSNAGDLAGVLVYTSPDGGKTWLYDAPPLPNAKDVCGGGDPAVAIGAHGEQAVGFIAAFPCGESRTKIVVAHRGSSDGEWKIAQRAIAEPGAGEADDKPTLAFGPNGLYASWTRYRRGAIDAMVARSPDGGAHWQPAQLVGNGAGSVDTSVAAARRGPVFAAWAATFNGSLFVSRSDSGRKFTVPHEFAKAPNVTPAAAHCPRGESGTAIPAQPLRCVTQNPHLALDRSGGHFGGRVYVAFENGDDAAVQDVYLAAFSPNLALLPGFPRRVNPSDGKTPSDQFLPAITVDQSNGTVWVCYYDTRGDSTRRSAWFTCAASLDGGETFLHPVHAATAPSDLTQRPADVDFGFGEYAGVAAAGGVAHPIWTDGRALNEFGEEIYTTRIEIRR